MELSSSSKGNSEIHFFKGCIHSNKGGVSKRMNHKFMNPTRIKVNILSIQPVFYMEPPKGCMLNLDSTGFLKQGNNKTQRDKKEMANTCLKLFMNKWT